MHPLPPFDPRNSKDYSRGGGELSDLVPLILAGVAIWRFGFWPGIAIWFGGMFAITSVDAINRASARHEPSETRARSRGPWPARLHSLLTSVLAGIIGYGASAEILNGASGTFAGIVAAATALLVMETAVDRLLEMDWAGAVGSWCFLLLVWAGVSVPVAAWIAPGYALHGIGANVAAIVLVYGAHALVLIASPWRDRWQSLKRP